jgi:arsenate reductase-like glutaredoxin family protein
MLDPNEYKVTKENLDMRICDVEPECENTQTYREYIRESEAEFGFTEILLEELTDKELKFYLAELDYLWTK